jgi:hypothetical protein
MPAGKGQSGIKEFLTRKYCATKPNSDCRASSIENRTGKRRRLWVVANKLTKLIGEWRWHTVPRSKISAVKDIKDVII